MLATIVPLPQFTHTNPLIFFLTHQNQYFLVYDRNLLIKDDGLVRPVACGLCLALATHRPMIPASRVLCSRRLRCIGVKPYDTSVNFCRISIVIPGTVMTSAIGTEYAGVEVDTYFILCLHG